MALYTDIVIIVQDQAEGGSKVPITIKVKNIQAAVFYTDLIDLTVQIDSLYLTLTPKPPQVIPKGGTVTFATNFIMPFTKNVLITATSYGWVVEPEIPEGLWDKDDIATAAVYLVVPAPPAPVPEFAEFAITEYNSV